MRKVVQTRDIALDILIPVRRNGRSQIVISCIELRLEVIVYGKREVLHVLIHVSELALKVDTVIALLKDRL